jgi:hypothetical protein
MLLLVGTAIAAVSYSGSNYIAGERQLMSSPAFVHGDQTYPNPGHTNVTLIGTINGLTINPTCSYSNPPCAITAAPLYYIVVYGTNNKIRLIFPNSTVIPINGSHLIVTGVYVTPSTYKPDQWSPQMEFLGDLYVRTYSYTFLPFI